MVRLKKEHDIEFLRESGKILSYVLHTLAGEAREGMHLKALDSLAQKLITERGAASAFLGYQPEGAERPYPASICTSVNEVVVHGIPREYRLKQGDVLKIDAGVNYKGYITDSAITVIIGKVPTRVKQLVEVTEDALQEALRECVLGNTLGDIGYAIERTAKKGGFKVIKGLTGHGVGFELHEDPVVLNYGKKGTGMKLVPGLVLAIEPMFSLDSEHIHGKPDGSYATEDGSISAHFEHTVVITEKECEVLTQ